MFKKWIEDIRVKTKAMDRAQKKEYIMAYYWYHILIAFVLLVIAGIVIYHIVWGSREKLFSLAIVNQQIDYERDEKLSVQFAESIGVNSKEVFTDSDYLLSYGDVELDGVKESSFEKFFLGWQAGVLDAVIMPESFFKYCIEKDGEFTGIEELCQDMGLESKEDAIYKYNGQSIGIYIEKTGIAGNFIFESTDPVILVFLKNSKHLKECREFAGFVLQG